MKREMLRINNLNVEYSSAVKLINISLCLLAGECVGLLGLVNSGKNLLVDLICGKQIADQISFYVDGRKCCRSEELQQYVYKISVSNYVIDDWTVAEYICLVDEHSFLGIIQKKKLESKAVSLMKRLNLGLDANKKLKNLTELEKRLVDLVKACSREVKILVIEDEFEGCSTQDIKQFKAILDRVMQEDMVTIINSNSDYVTNILSDKYVIFKKGYVVKKCRKDYIRDNNHLENYLLGSSTISKKKDLDSYTHEPGLTGDILYSVHNIILKNGKELNLDFYKSEVITILSLDVKEKERIFEVLAGRYIDKYLDIRLEQKQCCFNDIIDFAKHRIASVGDMGGESELLLSMSTGNNLLIPSLNKLSVFQHVFMQRKVLKMLEKEVKDNLTVRHENVKSMSVNDYISLLLERWYIYKPKVLILFEPFIHCDIYGVSLVKSYIKRFTGLGTTVIIVKSREEYMEDISDRMISVD
jgi:ABC-type sugar transport system ATPase subunit